jgi:hypothetical protein
VSIAVMILLLSVLNHRKLRFTARKNQTYILSFLNFILEQFFSLNISARQKQAVSPQDNTLLQAVADRTLVIFLEEREGDSNPWTAVH